MADRCGTNVLYYCIHWGGQWINKAVCPGELKFEAIKHLCHTIYKLKKTSLSYNTHTNITTMWSLKIEIFAHFLCSWTQLALGMRSPFTAMHSDIFFWNKTLLWHGSQTIRFGSGEGPIYAPSQFFWRGQAFFSLTTSTLCSENTVLKDPSRNAWFFLCLAERNVCQIFTSKLQHLQLKGNKAVANLSGWGYVGGSTALYWEYCPGSTALHYCLGSTALHHCPGSIALHQSTVMVLLCIALKCAVLVLLHCTEVCCLGSTALHWSVLCTALKCTVLVLWNCIEVDCVLHWSALSWFYGIALKCTVYCTEVYCLGSMELHWSVLHWSVLSSTALHWSVLCTALKCTVLVLLHCTEGYCTFVVFDALCDGLHLPLLAVCA